MRNFFLISKTTIFCDFNLSNCKISEIRQFFQFEKLANFQILKLPYQMN